MERNCGTCRYWIDFMQFFGDPEEPDDYGYCYLPASGEDTTKETFVCDHYELHPDLEDIEDTTKETFVCDCYALHPDLEDA